MPLQASQAATGFAVKHFITNRIDRARDIDRIADHELSLGRHGVAERLARMADDLRSEVTA